MGRSRISKNAETTQTPAVEQATPPAAQPETNGTHETNGSDHQTNGRGHRKLTCPAGLTLKKFMDEAKELEIEVMGVKFNLKKKLFSTGSFGWFDQKNAAASICGVDGGAIHMQFNFTVVDSKNAARE